MLSALGVRATFVFLCSAISRRCSGFLASQRKEITKDKEAREQRETLFVTLRVFCGQENTATKSSRRWPPGVQVAQSLFLLLSRIAALNA
jgi:hypothetical protein